MPFLLLEIKISLNLIDLYYNSSIVLTSLGLIDGETNIDIGTYSR